MCVHMCVTMYVYMSDCMCVCVDGICVCDCVCMCVNVYVIRDCLYVCSAVKSMTLLVHV